MINHLWQSTLFAAIAGLLTLALRANHARARHALWLAASFKFLIPFSLLVAIGSHLDWTAPHSRQLHSLQPQVAQLTVAMETVVTPSPALSAMVPASSNWLSGLLALVWACGFAVIILSWSLRWWRMRAAVNVAPVLGIRCSVEVRSSPTLLEPGIWGIFHPILLLPDGIVDRLTPEQLESIVAHELCHVRHRDNLTSALHMLVEAIFWFHPLVWWIGTRLVAERERACDEEVVKLGNEPRVYAEGILKVCEVYLESPLACVAGVTGSNLKQRIEEIMTHHVAHKLGLTRKLLLGAAAITTVAGPIVIGLLNAPPSRAQTQPAAGGQPSFEVASIKPSAPGGRGMQMQIGGGGRFNAKNVTVKMLIQHAYNVRDFQISGGPAWLTSEHYDVVAKAEGDQQIRPEQLRLMVQALLADRFKLTFHRDTKELPIYALVVAKNGPKLQPSEAQGEEQRMMRMGRGQVTAQGVGIDMLANNLAQQLGRTVIDKTGLTGRYDLKLEWTPDISQPFGPKEFGPDGPPPAADPGGPSIFTALQEQLGLKLETQKGPVEIIVIDHIEKASEN